MKKTITLIISLCILFGLCACQKKEAKPKEDIYIVFTSDVHCSVNDNLTLPGVKAYVNELKSEHNDVLLVDCGDYLQGGTVGTLSKGEYIVELMNEMGYDVVTFGNHEFDYGMDQLQELIGKMNADMIACNVRYTGTKGNIFENVPGYVIKEVNGVKVAFIGILTPGSISSSKPIYFMENGEFVYDFYSGNNGQDLYDRVQSVVDEARKKGADYVVALSHLGSDEALYPNDAISMISHTSGIDVVLDGHSHSMIVEDRYPNKNGEDVILSSVGTKLEAVGTLIIDTEGNMATMHLSEYNKKDEGMIAKIDEINSKLDVLLSRKVSEIDFDLYIADEEGVRMIRNRETSMGDFVCDAYRTILDTDVAIYNGGGIRVGVKAGDVTYNDLLSIVPFQNNIISIYATGQQIVDALEFGARKAEGLYKLDGNAVGEFGGFLQVSNLKYSIDSSIPSVVTLDDNNMFAGFDGDQRRVYDVYVLKDGEYVPIELDKTYSVASTEYLFYFGGDGNNIFMDCQAKDPDGIMDVDGLIEYVEEYGIDERYKTVDDRITVR